MTKFLKIKKLVSRHTKGFQAINEHMLLQNCGEYFILKCYYSYLGFDILRPKHKNTCSVKN